jgi:hypothetical protein
LVSRRPPVVATQPVYEKRMSQATRRDLRWSACPQIV